MDVWEHATLLLPKVVVSVMAKEEQLIVNKDRWMSPINNAMRDRGVAKVFCQTGDCAFVETQGWSGHSVEMSQKVRPSK